LLLFSAGALTTSLGDTRPDTRAIALGVRGLAGRGAPQAANSIGPSWGQAQTTQLGLQRARSHSLRPAIQSQFATPFPSSPQGNASLHHSPSHWSRKTSRRHCLPTRALDSSRWFGRQRVCVFVVFIPRYRPSDLKSKLPNGTHLLHGRAVIRITEFLVSHSRHLSLRIDFTAMLLNAE